jgi:hypothetical protein
MNIFVEFLLYQYPKKQNMSSSVQLLAVLCALLSGVLPVVDALSCNAPNGTAKAMNLFDCGNSSA